MKRLKFMLLPIFENDIDFNSEEFKKILKLI